MSVSVIRWLASRCARRRIDVDGLPYLDRYYLVGPMPEGLASLWPDDDRPRQRLRWLRRTWYLHRFHRPDNDRHLHNHPWHAVGMILHGAYVEVRSWLGSDVRLGDNRYTLRGSESGCKIRTLRAGNLQRVGPSDYHSVACLQDSEGRPTDEVWTLFGTCEKLQSWGYLVDGEHVGWREYQSRKYGSESTT